MGLQPRAGYNYSIVQSLLVITFHAEAATLRRLFLPEPLKTVGDGTECCMVFCDSMFPGLREVDGEIPDPNSTEFRECAIGVPAEYNGKKFYVWSWILLDHYAGALRRGFNRNVVDITTRTKLHPMLAGGNAYGPGTEIHAIAGNYGSMMAEATFVATGFADKFEDALPDYFMNWGEIRYLPDYASGGNVVPLVHQASVQIMPGEIPISKPLVGKARLKFGGQQYNLFGDMEPITVEKSCFITLPFTYAREEFICDVTAKSVKNKHGSSTTMELTGVACLCNNVTYEAIRKAVECGNTRPAEVRKCLKYGNGCSLCVEKIARYIEKLTQKKQKEEGTEKL